MITNLKSISKGRRDIHDIDPRRLVDFAGLNERIDYGADFSELKEDIRLRGVTEPFKVKLDEGKVKVIKGYRRKRAVHELIAEKVWTHGTVPVVAEERGASMIDRLVDQITGNIAKPYTILEQGRIFERLQSEGLKMPEIAARTHKTRTHITNALALASAPPAVIAYVEQNKISDSLVIDLIREAAGDNEKLVAAVKAAIETAAASGKTHATRKHTGKSRKAKDQSKNGSADQTTIDIGEVTPDEENIYTSCLSVVQNHDEPEVSVSLFQRRLRLGYTTAKRMVDILIARNVIDAVEGEDNGTKKYPIRAIQPGETGSTAEEDADKIVAWLRSGKPQHVSAAAMASALGLDAAAVNGAIAILRTRQILGEPNQDGLFAVQISFLEGADVQQLPEHRTDWSSVDSNGGSNNAPESLSYDSTKNLVKLNKILEDLPSEESDPVVRNAVEATINFLEGKMDTKAMKSFLRL
jgi:ParB/RepB/Spo0J family partition protein